MEYLKYIREYLAGFRMPNLSKLWYGSDEVDSSNNEPIVVQMEYYLVKVQELALWTDPQSSAIALGVVHLFFAYVATTSNTTLNLAIWAFLSGLFWVTWTQKIWPEIRVEKPKEKKTTSQLQYKNPDVFTASELQDTIIVISGKSKRLYTSLVEMRRNTPGKFCFAASAFFVVLAYVGSAVSAFCLFYYLIVGALVVPGCLRYTVENYPPANEMLVKLRIKEEAKAKAKTSKKSGEDVPDGSSTYGIVGVRSAADKMSSIMQNVCSTLQTGVTSLASNLPDLHQLELQQKQLKEDSEQDTENMSTPVGQDGSTLTDDLAAYMPDVSNIENSQILETCVREFELGNKDPTRVESFENDEAHQSMIECSMAGLDQSLMPGHEELESMHYIKQIESQRPEESSANKLASPVTLVSITYDDFDDANREFLPAKTADIVTSNIITDEFELEEDDSRQLSIDPSYTESHMSDNGDDVIPYDNNDSEVRAAMEELIDEEEQAMLPLRCSQDEIDCYKLRPEDQEGTPSGEPDRDTCMPSTNTLKDSISTSKKESIDESLEEDFELISAEELSFQDQ